MGRSALWCLGRTLGKAAEWRCHPGLNHLGLCPLHWSWPLLAEDVPGRKGRRGLLERSIDSIDVSRRLATQAGFAEAALFFKQKQLFFSRPLSRCIGGRLFPREEMDWSMGRQGTGRKPAVAAGLGWSHASSDAGVSGRRGGGAAGGLQLNRTVSTEVHPRRMGAVRTHQASPARFMEPTGAQVPPGPGSPA